jgi:hypothetical protein
MKRHGWKFVALVFIAVASFFWLIKAPVLSTYLTEKLGIEVTTRRISVWPSVTTMHHFRVSNPDRFRSPNALSAKKVTLHYQFGSMISAPRTIDEIVLEDVHLNIDILSNSKNNWGMLAASLPQARHGSRVIIRKLIIRNLTVTIEGKGARLLGVDGTKHFAQMEFNDIDSADGFPTKELMAKIFNNAGLLKYLENLLNPVRTIKKTLNPFNIF